MKRRFIICLSMILAFYSSALADPAATVVSEADVLGKYTRDLVWLPQS